MRAFRSLWIVEFGRRDFSSISPAEVAPCSKRVKYIFTWFFVSPSSCKIFIFISYDMVGVLLKFCGFVVFL